MNNFLYVFNAFFLLVVIYILSVVLAFQKRMKFIESYYKGANIALISVYTQKKLLNFF